MPIHWDEFFLSILKLEADLTLKILTINHAARFLPGQYERLRKVEFYGAPVVIQIVNQ